MIPTPTDPFRGEACARTWNVAALLLAASDALQARLGAISVRGEVSGFSRAASGHCYFNLKDSSGQAAMLRCAMFRRAASLLDFRPSDGQQVEVRGRIAVYEARGELQCVVEAMLPLGAGSLYELFMRLKARLEAQGLFAAERKRPLPAHPRAVGVVTSLQAAALHDVLTAIARRAPHVRLVVYPCSVQGSEAPAQIVQAIAAANARAEVEVLLVVRGGGSIEDLWAFNDEQVVLAVASSALPVVCGVGHETDLTLAELAADLRAPTPTAAAELATPVAAEELARLRDWRERSQRGLQRRLDQLEQRLDVLSLHLGRPARWLTPQAALLQRWRSRAALASLRGFGRHATALATWRHRVESAGLADMQRRVARLDGLQARLAALDPREVLARGYAWLSDSTGRPVTSARALHEDERLQAQWSDGRATVQVLDIGNQRPFD